MIGKSGDLSEIEYFYDRGDQIFLRLKRLVSWEAPFFILPLHLMASTNHQNTFFLRSSSVIPASWRGWSDTLRRASCRSDCGFYQHQHSSVIFKVNTFTSSNLQNYRTSCWLMRCIPNGMHKDIRFCASYVFPSVPETGSRPHICRADQVESRIQQDFIRFTNNRNIVKRFYYAMWCLNLIIIECGFLYQSLPGRGFPGSLFPVAPVKNFLVNNR